MKVALIVMTVNNPDEIFSRAIYAEATQIWPIKEEYVCLPGRNMDPFGHHWEIDKPLPEKKRKRKWKLKLKMVNSSSALNYKNKQPLHLGGKLPLV